MGVEDVPGPAALLDRICRLLAAEKGYGVLGLETAAGPQPHGVGWDGVAWRIAVVPELAPLAERFDRVLVRTDGMTFEVLCIRDRASAPERRVEAGLLEDLLECGRGCLRYTGTVNRRKMPVILYLWEVCGGGPADVDHLRAIRASPLRGNIDVSAWSLSPADGRIWTNARLGGLFHGKPGLRKLLARAASGEELRAEEAAPVGRPVAPVMTVALTAALVAAFVAQLAVGDWSGVLTPTLDSLAGLGGLNRALVVDRGQWYRLLSSGFLHGGPLHLGLNGLALVLGGLLLERLVGRAWLLVLFTLSLVGGSAMSLLLNGPEVISVGASGAIMGLLAAAFVITFRLPHGQARSQAQVGLVYWLVPALIPLARPHGPRIDFAGHLGGALTGFALGWLMLQAWDRRESRPPFRVPVGVAAGLCAALLAVGLGQAGAGAARFERARALERQLAPQASLRQIPSLTVDKARPAVEALLRRYPRDPRVLFYASLTTAGDAARSEALLRSALAERALLDAFFSDGRLEAVLRGHLARALLERGAEDEARAVVRPACAAVEGAAPGVLPEEFVRGTCR